jgi:hypothetical protein
MLPAIERRANDLYQITTATVCHLDAVVIRVAANDCSDGLSTAPTLAAITKIDLAGTASSERSAARTKIREIALTIVDDRRARDVEDRRRNARVD